MIRIITDSVSSIPQEIARQEDITVMPLYLHFDGEEHVESELDIDAFYETIDQRINDIPTSSQPSQHTFESFMEDAAQCGDSVLGVFLSSELSGTYEGAIRAARAVKAHNLDFTCVLIDSTSAGYDEAFPALDAADTRNEGGSLEECAASAINAVMCSRILFAPESLTFLKAGGRIGGARALLGNMIKIVPVLTVENGIPTDFVKVRTTKKAIEAIFQTFKDDVEEHGLARVMLHYIGKPTSALDKLKELVEDFVGRSVSVLPVSPVLGSHVGPAIGIAYECLQYVKRKFDGDPTQLVFTT